MGLLTDFFIARPQEIKAAKMDDLPAAPMVEANGIDMLALEILARVLIGRECKDLLTTEKNDFAGLVYLEDGCIERESMITVLRGRYHERYSDDELEEMERDLEELEKRGDVELMQEIFAAGSVERVHPTFVEHLGTCPVERLQSAAMQWIREWAQAMDNQDLLRSDTVEALLLFLQNLSHLARQAREQGKCMYYKCSL